jgi:hypothetical protein
VTTGELLSWDDKVVVLATENGKRRIAVEDLLTLRWLPTVAEGTPSEKTAPAQAELIDESLIPIADYQSTGTNATLKLAVTTPSGDTVVEIPGEQVAAVQFKPLQFAATEQWREIRQLGLAGDILVLQKRDGASLDYVEGSLGYVTADKIEFKLDGESARIDRRRVAGIVYFQGQRESDAEPRCVIHGRSGLRANGVRAQFENGLIEIETASGVNLRWPMDDIYLADFSAGKLLYLSDMKPASEKWTPLVGLPAGIKSVSKYGRPRNDQSAYGGLLSLASPDELGLSLGRTRQFNKGLALRSRTELAYRLPTGFQRMRAVAGIDPAVTGDGNVRLLIHGDDRLLLEAEISGREPPQPIDLDIGGVKRLTIVVDYGRNLDSGDWLNLCDARIVK